MLVNESVELDLGNDKNLYYPEKGETYFSLVFNKDTKAIKAAAMYRCRESFCYALSAYLIDKPFKPMPSGVLQEKLNIKDLSILILISGKKANQRFIRDFERIVHPYDESLGVKKSSFRQVSNYKGAYVIDLDPKWLSSVILASLYTLIVRTLTEREISSHDTIESMTGKANLNNLSDVQRSFIQIDLHHFLRNIDEVLGDNPITGVNDFKYGFSNPEVKELDLNQSIDEIELDGKIKKVDRDIYRVISITYLGGIYSFSYRVDGILYSLKSMKDMTPKSELELFDVLNGRRDYSFPIGLKWVFNYVKILIKESNEKRDT